MAITSVKLHWTGTTGDRELRRGVEYTAVWFVTTNNKLDQAQTVLNGFEAHVDGAARGDVYTFASDTATGPAYLRKLSATRKQDSQIHWEVVGTYASDTDASVGRDSSGSPAYDPLDFAPNIRVKNVQYQRIAEKATYLSGLVGAAATSLPAESLVPPMNSCFVPFDDPLMVDKSHCIIEIEKNVLSYDGSDDDLYQNVVNSICFRVVKPIYAISLSGGVATYVQTGTYERQVLALTGKIREIQTDFESINEIDFIRVRYIIDVRPETWRHDLLDKGTVARARAGDPDGRGGTIGSQGVIVPTGAPPLRRITDLEDRPVPSPVLLDGDGGPLDTTGVEGIGWSPVYLTYRTYEELDFLSIPFLSTILTTCTGTGTGTGTP